MATKRVERKRDNAGAYRPCYLDRAAEWRKMARAGKSLVEIAETADESFTTVRNVVQGNFSSYDREIDGEPPVKPGSLPYPKRRVLKPKPEATEAPNVGNKPTLTRDEVLAIRKREPIERDITPQHAYAVRKRLIYKWIH